jgi:hypothetical protein
MKPGTENILLIGGAGIALYIIMKGGDLTGGPSDIFGGKEAKGTVASNWTGSGDSGGAAIPESFTKKEAAATGYTPTSFGEPSQALLDQYYQRNIEPTLTTKKDPSSALAKSIEIANIGTGGVPVTLAGLISNVSPSMMTVNKSVNPSAWSSNATPIYGTGSGAPVSFQSPELKKSIQIANIGTGGVPVTLSGLISNVSPSMMTVSTSTPVTTKKAASSSSSSSTPKASSIPTGWSAAPGGGYVSKSGTKTSGFSR